ncbi:MAG: NfeD family protein [Candidatus Omnitrophota bacterium]
MSTLFVITSLFIIGFVLIFIEVVLIPGIGFAGILGAISLVAACYTAFESLSTFAGILISLTSIILTVIFFKILPKTAFWQKTRLSLIQNKSQGYQVAQPEFKELINKKGIALTMLRPSGTIIIENKRYDVVTDGEFIEKDQEIIVYDVEGNKIVVKKTDKV